MRSAHPRTCPLCGKPLFYAPYAPEDTAKTACSDPDCENAHGIINWNLPNFRGKMCPMTHKPTCKPRETSFHRGIPIPSAECTCQVDMEGAETVD